jgi:hypothetical protein
MRHLAKNLRRRAAIAMAVAYALCVLAPPVTQAIAAIPAALHCVSEQTASTAAHDHGTAHDHADTAVPHHGEDNTGNHHSGKDGNAVSCCGLFCVSALAHDPGLTFGVSAPASPSIATLANGLTGRAPSPLHRPPIA